jgi:cell surface protein SprA
LNLRFPKIVQLIVVVFLFLFFKGISSNVSPYFYSEIYNKKQLVEKVILPLDSPETNLPFPINDNINPYGNNSGLDLNNPANIESAVEYDPATGNYYFYQRVGGELDYRNPTVMSFEEYINYNMANSVKDYWKEIKDVESITDEDGETSAFAPKLKVNGKAFDRIFGGNTIDIRPQGSAELTFGVNINKNENPQIPERQRRVTTFDFDQKIQMNVVGNIGDKMKLTTNYNTEATFDFENQMKLEYTGYEDEIIKKIEAGNVSLPLSGTLIAGSQSLFGIKTQLQFGRLTATTLFSQQKGQRKEIDVQGGAQTQKFEITADNYEANKHYFLSGYFRENYDRALSSLPVVNSGINITRIEVWVVNQRANTLDTRNIIGFTDLGEDAAYQSQNEGDNPINNFPDNQQNSLYNIAGSNLEIREFTNASSALSGLLPPLVNSVHYEKLSNARRLEPSEYTYNARLGFISLNQPLNNAEVLAVGYQYTINGQTFQVGDLSNDGIIAPNALFLKLLKSTIVDVRNPMWDLMMKNIYSLNAYQVNSQEFICNVWYNDPKEGIDIPFIPIQQVEATPLLQFFNLDKLDQNGSSASDGRFDFVDGAATNGGTINSQNGRIFFPVIEPFGSYLRTKLQAAGVQESSITPIAYPQLYDSTKTVAQQNFLPLNRFKLKGSYQSASSDEISLNATSIPQGSVTVTAGGVKLEENRDYTVDYNLGRVKIINTGLLESQTPIKVSLESNSLFSIQTKTLVGSRFDYKVNKDFNLGGTIMNLTERPLTNKVNVGDEPMSNTIFGFDGNYRRESNYITKLVDRLPFLETKEKSSVEVSGEFAKLVPGHSRAVGKDGISYIDDFEGSQSTIDLRGIINWQLASIPQKQPTLFPEDLLSESNQINNLQTGYNRAKIAWHTIDILFFNNDNNTPENIDPKLHFQRQVLEGEVFPNRQLPSGTPSNIATLDLAYYPSERGPYNYDAAGVDNLSFGINADGLLNQPQTRWAGITRAITTTDFEQSNIEFIQFWMMDPYNEDSKNVLGSAGNQNGKLYINLGNISEDILRDGQMSFENGLPIDPNNPNVLDTIETQWATVPATQSIVNAFDNSTDSYAAQDVGLDGNNNSAELRKFGSFIDEITPIVNPVAFNIIQNDPSTDKYHYFRGDDYDSQQLDILERYKDFNGLDGNSITGQNPPAQSTTLPSTEDINQDLTLAEAESYYQYEIKMPDPDFNNGAWQVGQNYITNIVNGEDPNGRIVKWYQFRVPVREGQSINNIQDFRSIRFMRLFMKGFETPVVLRFARIELLRGEWRRFTESLKPPGEIEGEDPDQTTFDIAAVNVEENGQRTPINYVVPPGINQEIDAGSQNLRNLNEQSLVLRSCFLDDGDARAAFKNTVFDVRQYKKLKMFVHAESLQPEQPIAFGDLTVFIRLGTDFDQNYYEYELPLTPTNEGASDASSIWPEANNIEIEFSKLQQAKTDRNAKNFPLNNLYEVSDGKNRIFIKGNPVLSSVKTIMIGIRNPEKDAGQQYTNIWITDDGQQKCAEIWVNELRLTDFNNEGGWAAIARVNAKLADFGNISVAGNYSKPGFGNLDSKVSERQQQTIIGVDASSNLELGKFLPESSGIKVPMFLGFSQQITTPQYDPLSPDLEINEVTRSLTSGEKRKIKKTAQTFVRRRSINFTNVRKEKTGGGASKSHFYDVENVSLTYAYNEINSYDINTEFNNTKTFRGGLDYVFSPKPKSIKPFAQIKLFRTSKYLALFKDFNFNLGPKQLGFRTEVNRTYNENKIRNNTEGFVFEQPALYTKTFNWTRGYDVGYDITNNLKFTYNANNQALIGEPQGRVNNDFDEEYQQFKDSVWNSVKSYGLTTTFNQASNLTYKLPLDKLPITDWITADVKYTGTYNWQRAPLSQDSLGNTIQNSRNIALNQQFNFLTLYNKVPYFKKVNNKFKNTGKGKDTKQKVKAATPEDTDPSDKKEEKDKSKEKKDAITPIDYVARLFMSLKQVSVRYSQNEGTLLPGYDRRTNVIGLDPQLEAPGLPFVFGHQEDNFAFQAGFRGWLIQNPYLNSQFSKTYSEDFNFKVNLEPMPNLRVDFTSSLTNTKGNTSFFRYNQDLQDYLEDSRVETGSFNMTFIAWKTAFVKDGADRVSRTFQNFLANRQIISNRLAAETNNSAIAPGGYAEGYGSTSQEVILPAFLAAYGGKNAKDVKLNPLGYSVIDAIKNPNWNITYDGLSKIKALKKYFKSVTLSHGYRSTYSVNGFTTNLAAAKEGDPPIRDNSLEANFIPALQISAVTIAEQLSPLLNIDMTWQNSLITKFEIKKDRSLSLSTANYQLTETKGEEYVIGLGYRIPDVEIKIGGKKRKSDLNCRADFSYRNNLTIIRRVQEGTNQPTSGQQIYSIKTSVDYVISEKLNIRAFYDQQINKPVVSYSFRTSNVNAGISLRFTLTQ